MDNRRLSVSRSKKSTRSDNPVIVKVNTRHPRRIKQLSAGSQCTHRTKQLSSGSATADFDSFWGTGETEHSTRKMTQAREQKKNAPTIQRVKSERPRRVKQNSVESASGSLNEFWHNDQADIEDQCESADPVVPSAKSKRFWTKNWFQKNSTTDQQGCRPPVQP